MKTFFIHIPKTAGTSVTDIINNNENYIYIGHYPILLENGFIDMNKLFFFNNFNNLDCKSFAVVRNPYTRLISAFTYLKKGGNGDILDLQYQELLNGYNFEDFVLNLNFFIKKIVHLIPQHVYICNGNNILVTHLCKFENLNEDLKKVDSIFDNLPHLNKSSNDILVHNLSFNIKIKIYLTYKKDFELFGYDFFSI